MARIGIAIVKSTAFRDSTQEFSNVYHYENGGALPNEAGALALIDELTALEKARHAAAVNFVRGRCWSAGGSPAANNMIGQKSLSGVGALTTQLTMDRERAYLFRWSAGVDSRGNPVYLRKWYHTCGPGPGNVSPPDSVLNNTAGFAQGSRDTMVTSIQALAVLASSGGGWELVAKSGRTYLPGSLQAHKYLEHHQLGDMWRG